MSLALHYWMGGAHHCSLHHCPVSEMTYTVSSGTLNPSIPYHTPKFWTTSTKFGITHVGEVRVSRGLAMPTTPRGGPQPPPNFWDLLHACTQYEKQQPNFAHDDEARCGENCTRSTWMLTRDMFAVANLLNCIICLFWLNVCLFNFVITGSIRVVLMQVTWLLMERLRLIVGELSIGYVCVA